jgi:hypothetical protein
MMLLGCLHTHKVLFVALRVTHRSLITSHLRDDEQGSTESLHSVSLDT